MAATIKSIAALLILVCFAALASCNAPTGTGTSTTGQPDSLATIKSSGTIRVGWAPYAPYASIDTATNKPTGFYISLIERVADESGLKISWVETTWGTMISDLYTNKFDVMAAPVFKTIPRAKEVAFTRTIDYFGLSALVRKNDARFSTVEDFNQPGIVIAVTEGEVGHEFAQRHLPRAQLKVYQTGNISLALVDVVQGKADAGISDAWTIKQFAAEHSGEVKDLFAEHPFNRVGAGWFVRSDDYELLDFLNTSIDWLESTGTVSELAKTYDLPSSLQ